MTDSPPCDQAQFKFLDKILGTFIMHVHRDSRGSFGITVRHPGANDDGVHPRPTHPIVD